MSDARSRSNAAVAATAPSAPDDDGPRSSSSDVADLDASRRER